MKSLNKMIATAAAMATMCFGAKAEEKVVEATVSDGAEINSIELVNGQLLVRCNDKAEIQGEKTPYVYVGTNTVNFAEDAFAQGGLTNVAQYVHAGNGQIYMTETGNTNQVWTTTVGAPNAGLNGVKFGVTEVDLEQDPVAKAVLNASNAANADQLTAVDGTDVFTVTDDAVLMNGASSDYISQMAGKTKKEVFVALDGNGKKHGYVLADDNGVSKLYGAQSKFYDGVPADSVTVSADKKQLNIVSGSKVTVYDTASKAVVSETTLPVVGNEKVKSAVSTNGIIYYATAKKLGYKTIGE